MQRNPNKYKAIVFGTDSHSDQTFVCENTVFPLKDDMDLLGVTVDSKSKFDTHVAKLVCK